MIRAFLFSLLSLALFSACNAGGDDDPTDEFDRRAMLTAYASNFIQPSFNELAQKNSELIAAANQMLYETFPSEGSVINTQDKWKAAFLAWQNCNKYNFGPAGESGTVKGLVEEIGTFPVSTTKIEDRIAAGTWNFNDFDRDARGYLAVEYLLFRRDSNNIAVLNSFLNDPKRKEYLVDLLEDIQSRVVSVRNEWNNNYFIPFINNTGTDVGSSTSQLYNEFVKSFEALKNFKLGLPLGNRPGQVQAEPQLVEAYYSGRSIIALKAHFNAIDNFWRGRTATDTVLSFRDYLLSVEGGPELVQNTDAQIAKVHNSFLFVPPSPALADAIAQDAPRVDSLYTELQKLTRYFKSDMSSVLGISITFASGDGD